MIADLTLMFSREDRKKFIYSKYVRRRFTEGFAGDDLDKDYDNTSLKKSSDAAKGTAMVEYVGVLSIHLIKGTRLISCDLNGLSLLFFFLFLLTILHDHS